MHRSRLLLLVRGQLTYPQAEELRKAAKLIPDELLLVETDAPFLSPQDFRGKPNEPAFVRSTAAFLAELRGQSYEQLEAGGRVERRLDLPLVNGQGVSLARASRERMARFGVRPNRELGQNFLVDDNILGRDRARGRARPRTTSCSRSAAGSGS